MTYRSYSLVELEHLLKTEQADFLAYQHAKFASTKPRERQVPRFRWENKNDGDLFVVANDGKTAIVFDDVEEEFAICKSHLLDGVVREWGLAGSLVFALMHLK